jgi:hypothetical protein
MYQTEQNHTLSERNVNTTNFNLMSQTGILSSWVIRSYAVHNFRSEVTYLDSGGEM